MGLFGHKKEVDQRNPLDCKFRDYFWFTSSEALPCWQEAVSHFPEMDAALHEANGDFDINKIMQYVKEEYANLPVYPVLFVYEYVMEKYFRHNDTLSFCFSEADFVYLEGAFLICEEYELCHDKPSGQIQLDFPNFLLKQHSPIIAFFEKPRIASLFKKLVVDEKNWRPLDFVLNYIDKGVRAGLDLSNDEWINDDKVFLATSIYGSTSIKDFALIKAEAKKRASHPECLPE